MNFSDASKADLSVRCGDWNLNTPGTSDLEVEEPQEKLVDEFVVHPG